MSEPRVPRLPHSNAPPNDTMELIARARGGDAEALERLFARYLKPLRRSAAGRLPQWARDMTDTLDLVRDTLLQTFRKVDATEWRGEGALQAYLRQALMNGAVRARAQESFGRVPEPAVRGIAAGTRGAPRAEPYPLPAED